jgi:hypothetical protein
LQTAASLFDPAQKSQIVFEPIFKPVIERNWVRAGSAIAGAVIRRPTVVSGTS